MSTHTPSAVCNLPIATILDDLVHTMESCTNCVLQAPAGAGKTTAVPLALLHLPNLRGRILMLEPRRLAARTAARRMAQLVNEQVGRTIGYRVRHENAVSSRTRIEVITEGILTRMIQNDPELSGVDCVIFDEFHERSLHSDLGLALCLEAQSALRPDLRILVMSATLDGQAVSALMGNCPVLTAEGRMHPVETRYLSPPAGMSLLHRNHAVQLMASAIRQALNDEQGSILAFLPGMREISMVAEALERVTLPDGSPVMIAPLHGSLPPKQQDVAIAPAPAGTRKVVLATSIAETSLTIEGIRIVVDCGLSRTAQFNPSSGMSGLVTRRASIAEAEQRKGRAGRLESGVCYRLWNVTGTASMPAFAKPEILESDLAPLALELARWGTSDYMELAWLTPPPPSGMRQARELLLQLGALSASEKDSLWRITPHGENMARLPLHPRLAHMLITAAASSNDAVTDAACLLAALLTERPDQLRKHINITHALDSLTSSAGKYGNRAGQTPTARFDNTVSQLQAMLAPIIDDIPSSEVATQLCSLSHSELPAALCALAYPDRIGKATERGRFVLTCGKAATVPADNPLATASYIVVPELDGQNASARIQLAIPIGQNTIESLFVRDIKQTASVSWNEQTYSVEAKNRRTLRELVLAEKPAPEQLTEEAAVAAMCLGIRKMGIGCLPWDAELESIRKRIIMLRSTDLSADAPTPCQTPWPDVSDTALLETLEDWLGPFLGGIRRRAQLKQVDLQAAFRALLPWPLSKRLDEEAPEKLIVPSGSAIRLDYSGPIPVLAVKLQEMFGATETPTIAEGKIAVLLHLLSPAGRPLQITQDLKNFWSSGYHAVKAEMKGRYPKHPWPDDPANATPTRKTRNAMGRLS
ncbi:ATP-dependent helicase HrpB [Oleidesulfovibrio sp.]|uniref:ATP-dependent helicase HrpB n=1 Tax=Oleidesulfovibrio sp. TaxID=2909707 RepID=UPI003A89AD94